MRVHLNKISLTDIDANYLHYSHKSTFQVLFIETASIDQVDIYKFDIIIRVYWMLQNLKQFKQFKIFGFY